MIPGLFKIAPHLQNDRKSSLNVANQLTIFRIVLVPVFIGSLHYFSDKQPYFYWISVTTFFLACLTDALDGYIARRYKQKTELGSYIDPLADKLLLDAGFLSLSFMTHLPDAMQIPAWVTISVITRDVIIVIGSAIVFMSTNRLKAEPLFVGKLTTVLQMMTLLVALLAAPLAAQYLFYAFTALFTVISGIHYVRMGGKLLNK